MDHDIETTLTKRSDYLLKEISLIIGNLEYNHEAVIVNKVIKLINEFEVSPSLLDKWLTEYMTKLNTLFIANFKLHKTSTELSRNIGKIVYTLSKVRRFKTIINFFDSDIHLIPILIDILQFDIVDDEKFLGLLWLSTLVLVPFNFDVTLIGQILAICANISKEVSNGSKSQKAILILLSRFLTRPDLVRQGFLDSYFKDLQWYDLPEEYKLGHLMVINKLLNSNVNNCIDPNIDIIDKIVHFELMNLRVHRYNVLNKLYVIKILCKMGEWFIDKHNFKQLESIINGLINDILLYEHLDTNLRYTMAKYLSKITIKLRPFPNYQEQVLLYVLELLDLNFQDTFGPIQIDYNYVSIPKYHTILLYFGYVALNKALPYKFIPRLLSLTHQTLFAYQETLNFNIVNQLKDSSCFIVWSLLRLISEDFTKLDTENPTMFRLIFLDLIELSIFDRDVVIRRCGVAVIQELVGRYGRCLFVDESDAVKGKQIVQFVELFTSSSVSTLKQSFNILNNLIQIGFGKGIIVNLLVKNFLYDFTYQRLVSRKLIEILSTNSTNTLNIGITEDVIPEHIVDKINMLDHSLYFKSELAKYLSISVEPLDYNKDYVEDYIMFLQYSCEIGTLTQYQSLLITIIHSNMDVASSLVELFRTMTKYGYAFPNEAFKNLPQFSLSLAKSIFYLILSPTQIKAIMEVIHSNADYEIRYNLISCLHANYNNTYNRYLNEMVYLLDDYTTTEQGDVGNRIREAMIDFIQDFLEEFMHVDSSICNSLIRISGESIEKLRYKAFLLLRRMKHLNHLDYSNLNNNQYYQDLFSLYSNVSKTEAIEFWKGLTASAGGLVGDSKNITICFQEFVRYYESSNNQWEIIRQISSLLSKRKVELPRVLKQYIQTLNFMIKIFESNLYCPLDLLMPLYVKCYNLQINTTDQRRIKLSLRLMECLVFQNEQKVSSMALKRIVSIFNNHKSTIIREYAFYLIYDIILNLGDKNVLNQFESMTKSEINEYIDYIIQSTPTMATNTV